MFLYFRKRKNAAHAAKKLRDVYGEEALKDRHCRNWFDKFHSGDFSLKDEQRSGRRNIFDDDQSKATIESDRHVTVRGIEEMLKIPKSTIDRHIQYSRKVLEQDKKSCFCQFIVSFIEILFTYSR